MSGLIVVKQKYVYRLDARSTMWHWPLTLTIAFALDFRIKISNNPMSEPIDMVGMESESIIHDHDRDLWVTTMG